MSPGPMRKQTGTVPKSKTPRKIAVPQEVVAPTRRDLQQHLSDFFASVQRASKRDNNNRTPAEGTCFELENTRSCWPVRPIPRKNLLADSLNNQNESTASNSASSMASINSHHLPASNTAIGVVIPRTPNTTTLHHHQNQLNETAQLLQQQFNQQLMSMRVPDGAPQQTRNPSKAVPQNDPDQAANVDAQLGSIQAYIRVTTSILESLNAEKSGEPRPQSVASIHTSAPNTPTYEELQNRLETSNRNMVNIKEQQQELLRIQQAAKNHLQEMEQLRAQEAPLSFNAPGNASSTLPNYDNVEEVTQDVSALMSRMKTLTDFIHNQNDLASSMGLDEKSAMLAEQTQLQNKLTELKNKKQQMAYLVNELQAMNVQADNSFDEDHSQHASQQSIERQSRSSDSASHRIGTLAQVNDDDDNDDEPDEVDDDDNDGIDGEATQPGAILQDKIAEINSMKAQLKRLQDMMHTVKLIDIKNGDYTHDDEASDDANNIVEPSSNANESQECLEEEQEMAERVRLLQNMTNDLRMQAVSLAAERDRLKDIKSEMTRRRDVDGSEKNCKQQQNQLTLTNATQKDQSFGLNGLHARKDDSANIIVNHNHHDDKRDSNDSPPNQKELLISSQIDPSQCIWPATTWTTPTHHLGSSTPSIRSGHIPCNSSEQLSLKTPPIASNPDKVSADSGAADVLNVSVGATSSQSCSSRGFSVPPPMRNISGRESAWQKTPQEMAHASPLNNQASTSYENQTEQNCSYYWGCGQACGNNAPQNPYYSNPYYHHHMCMPPMNITPSNDPVVMQQFIQTQQMLINSMSQCNQLLWEQQREINALNSAVVSLQERLLNSSAIVDPQAAYGRAESVPPNVVCTNQTPFMSRAQSEQPVAPNYAVPLPTSVMPPSPFRQYRGASMQSPVQQTPPQYNRHNNHRYRQQPLNAGRNSHPGGGVSSAINTTVAMPYYDSDHLHYSNNFVNTHNPTTNHMSDNMNNASVNNLHQQNLTHTASNSASNHNATNNVTALNNQVAPGIRANNYYDNFRSYSRQNLLSSSNCKSNDLPDPPHMTHNNLPLTIGNKFRNQINQQNTPPDVLNVNQQRFYHDVFDNFTTNTSANNLKSAGSCTTNGSSLGTSASGVAGSTSSAFAFTSNAATIGGMNVSANACATHPATANETSNLIHSIVNNINNNHNNENRCADDQKSINSNNFDVNELKQPKMASKTLQKVSTGGNKRTRSLHESSGGLTYIDRDSHQSTTVMNGTSSQLMHDLNLTNGKQQQLSKASPKLSDDVKEYVYQEVSALLEANETRPHFLINLFRELQLLSSSDPSRKQLLQTFQNDHAQCYGSSGASINMLSDAHSSTPLNIQNDLENSHHELAAHGAAFVGITDSNRSINSTSAACLPDVSAAVNDSIHSIISDISEQNEPNLCSILDLTAQQSGLNVEMSAASKTNELAEADQENVPQAIMSLQSSVDIEEHGNRSSMLDDANEAIGAVGGIDLSPLPDLAKVSSPSTE